MPPPPKPRVAVASTGKAPELVETLPIGRGSSPQVVMSMGQGGPAHASLPDLRAGDRLLVSAELEVTTDCAKQQSDCVGAPYSYAPAVSAALLLAGDPKLGAAKRGRAIQVGKALTRRVTHARHHDVLVYDNAEFVVPAGGLPWSGPAYLNLAAWASHPKASGGHRLIIGQHEPGGAVKGDMSGISVLRLRPADQAMPRAVRTTALSSTRIPVVTGTRAVVYSLRLDGLRKGEQLRVRSRLKPTAAHLTYPVRATTELILAEGSASTEPGRDARRVCPESPQICRGNGSNCLPQESPATVTKAGAMRITADAAGPLYVNAVVVVGDPLRRARRGHALDFAGGGVLEVVRFGPDVAG